MTVPKILKFKSLLSVKAPLETLTKAVAVLVAGTVNANLVVVDGTVVDTVVQFIPLFNEYSTV